jgi:hypothetical protein
VLGRFEKASANQEATVTIDRAKGLFIVRPLRSRRTYTMPLAALAEICVQRCIVAELTEDWHARPARRMSRGGLR